MVLVLLVDSIIRKDVYEFFVIIAGIVKYASCWGSLAPRGGFAFCYFQPDRSGFSAGSKTMGGADGTVVSGSYEHRVDPNTGGYR